MSAPKDGGPAFPSHRFETEDKDCVHPASSGMSLRDWFAGQAMTGLCGTTTVEGGTTAKNYAKLSYVLADAMLAERNKTTTEGE